MFVFQGMIIQVCFLLFLCAPIKTHGTILTDTIAQVNYVQLSQDFIYAAKTGDSVSAYINTLSKANQNELQAQLDTDNKRIAFWLNLYNAFTQVILKRDPSLYKSRNAFFSSRQISIAGLQVSLDLIEHGILRHSKIKWSLGYLGKLFPTCFEKKFRVNRVDYRVHFALNCGAKSCPPIAFYEPSQIEKQLSLATKNYLKNEVLYDEATNLLQLPAIMGWFRHDFGGKKKMIELVKKNGLVASQLNPAIRFKKYDWALFLSNYKTGSI